MGHFGFSYIGLIWLLMLFVPNLLWARAKPQGYSPKGENRLLQVLERAGEVGVTCAALLFADFDLSLAPGALTPWSWWLAASFALMLLYELWWLRYFTGPRTQRAFYSSLLGIPVAGATLPVLALFLLGIYGRVIWMLLACVLLGIGHIGIHLGHRREL